MNELLLRRRVARAKSLPYDAEIEYLESSGTQYIDTLTNGSNDLAVTISLELQSLASGRGLFGVYEASKNYFLYISGNGRWQIGFGNYSNINVQPDNNIHTFIFDNGVVKLDGTTVYTYEGSPFVSSRTLLLFNIQKTNGSRFDTVPTRIYYATFVKNGVAVMDLIPVRVGQTGYMYDKVSGQLFGNEGTGDFILGPDI